MFFLSFSNQLTRMSNVRFGAGVRMDGGVFAIFIALYLGFLFAFKIMWWLAIAMGWIFYAGCWLLYKFLFGVVKVFTWPLRAAGRGLKKLFGAKG